MARAQANLKFDVFDGLRGLSYHAKLLYLAILVEPTVNQAGAGALRERRWARDLEFTVAETEKALQELDEQRYVIVDDATEEILVRTLIRNDGVAEKPNLLWAACRAAVMVKSTRLRRVLAEELRKLPPKPEPTKGKNGRLYEHPDPHATADQIDPDPPDEPEMEPIPNHSGTSRDPSSNHAQREPFANHSRTSGGGGGGGGVSTEGLVLENSVFVREPPKRPAQGQPREDVERLCTHLADLIEANTANRPQITKRWRDSARLLLDKDLASETDAFALAVRVADWATNDEFWRTNVLSMPTFREKFTQLRLKARRQWEQRNGTNQPRRRTTDDKRDAVSGLVAEVFGTNGTAALRPELRSITGGIN